MVDCAIELLSDFFLILMVLRSELDKMFSLPFVGPLNLLFIFSSCLLPCVLLRSKDVVVNEPPNEETDRLN